MKRIHKVVTFTLIFILSCMTLLFVGCGNQEIERHGFAVKSSNTNYGKVYGKEGNYIKGDEAYICAVAEEGYIFTQWSDGNTDNPRIFTIEKDVLLTAHFEEKTKYAVIESVQLYLHDWWEMTDDQSIICKDWSVDVISESFNVLDIREDVSYGSNGKEELLFLGGSPVSYYYALNGVRRSFYSENGVYYANNTLETNVDVKDSIKANIQLVIAGVEKEVTQLELVDSNIIFSANENKLEVEFNYPNYGVVIVKFIYSVIY